MIIVSMAVIASRLKNIPLILKNLEMQTTPPDKVILYYSNEPWHLDDGIDKIVLPKSILDIETVKVPNLGSCRKYLYSIERYYNSNDSILLLDDDIMFDFSLIENLLFYQNEQRRVVTTRGSTGFIIEKDEKGVDIYKRPHEYLVVGDHIVAPTEIIVASSGWATMFFPKDINLSIFDRNIQESVNLRYSDEVYLAAMLPVSKYVIPMPVGFRTKIDSNIALKYSPETMIAKALQAKLFSKEVLMRIINLAA